MMPYWKTLHSDFKLNGLSCTWEDLKYLGYAFVKEGGANEKTVGSFLLNWSDATDNIKVNTSGSTGKPKQISLKKEHMVNSAIATGDFFDLKPKDSALLCLSADNIAGKMMLVRAIILGLELDFVEPSSSPLDTRSKNYDFCAMVPLQLANSLKKIDRIKTLIIGGAAISQKLQVQAQEQVQKTEIFETYGMTETITHVAIKQINNIEQGRHPELIEGRVETSFNALPDVTFSKDKKECLIIKAPKISEKQIVTNDIVNLISETEFEWLGRYDNVINSGGVKLFPEQIEMKLESFISNRFFVAGFPDEKLGEKLVLIVEGEIDTGKLFRKIDNLNSLEKYEVPKDTRVIPKFLETENGKIQRKSTINLILN